MKKLQQNITKNMIVKRPPISKPLNIKKADINDCEEIKMTTKNLIKRLRSISMVKILKRYLLKLNRQTTWTNKSN